MEMTGEVRIPASRDVVWSALNNPAVLKACIPGCEELTARSETDMAAVVAIRIGPVSSRFNCAVRLSELDAPHGYRLTGEGQGGVAGHARGEATVRLMADGAETVLSYTFSAQVGGKLAQLGSRLVDATAKTLSSVFFKNLAKQVEIRQQGEPSNSPEAAAPAAKELTATPPLQPARTMPARPAAASARGMAAAALIVAIVSAVLTWSSLGAPTAMTGAPAPVPVSAEFNAAVQLLIVLAVGYLLGRSNAVSRDTH
ncbi:hypothetical protein VAR608DRAFT_0876 [Variovorax sp. HW608]|uniref:CoxG family protein n=1 Tax=Variovorax sp. HW608 TaxID=1034889 RepID=UPI00081FDD01|nr:carbon monoxide dehydrogenase subunit G [Variovorax sp. HW608]SCK14318.1 hypothetical protein VAR608DRAFT_0876 [Variovorax sp. HW608]